MNNKTDLRVQKTHTALVETFFDMLCEKPFESITIQAICDKALVRRATFYTHFIDKYDLFAFTVRKLFNHFPAVKNLKEHEIDSNIYEALIEEIINFISANKKLVNSILSSNLLPIMINVISEEITEALSSALNKDDNLSAEITANFYVTAIIGTIFWWVKKKPSLPKETLIAEICKLL